MLSFILFNVWKFHKSFTVLFEIESFIIVSILQINLLLYLKS